MSEMEIFSFEGWQVRVLFEDGELRLVAADVAKILGYSAASAMIRRLPEHQKGVQILHTPGGDQQVSVITEGGLYMAIMRSNSPRADAFQMQVTEVILPSIRRTGQFAVAPASDALTLPRTPGEWAQRGALVAQELVSQLVAVTAENTQLQGQLIEQQPKIAAHDAFLGAKGNMEPADAAKRLCGAGIEIGRARLFAYMRNPDSNLPHRPWVMPVTTRRSGGTRPPEAYQAAIENRYLFQATELYVTQYGERVLKPGQIKITPHGLFVLYHCLTDPYGNVRSIEDGEPLTPVPLLDRLPG